MAASAWSGRWVEYRSQATGNDTPRVDQRQVVLPQVDRIGPHQQRHVETSSRTTARAPHGRADSARAASRIAAVVSAWRAAAGSTDPRPAALARGARSRRLDPVRVLADVDDGIVPAQPGEHRVQYSALPTPFRMQTELRPMGDQPRAIEEICSGVARGDAAQVLLGITGSGKIFTVANVVERIQRPTLVMAHNKTCASAYCEFMTLFHDNASLLRQLLALLPALGLVPSTDTSEKDSLINKRSIAAPRGHLRAADQATSDRGLCLHLRIGAAEATRHEERPRARVEVRRDRCCSAWSISYIATTSTSRAALPVRGDWSRSPCLRARECIASSGSRDIETIAESSAARQVLRKIDEVSSFRLHYVTRRIAVKR